MTAPRRRLLFIVSRERMDLYDALRKALYNEADCEVIIDRRSGERERREGERRTERGPEGRERRANRRRERIPVDNEIRECGWAVVRITTWPEAEAPRRGT
jgi:hypothetical protein